MLENKERTELSELGEFGLIKHLTNKFEIKNKSTVKGVGDDAAVIDNKAMQSVITTDMLIEGIHFDLSYSPLKHLGYKSVIVNLSDVYAMNAKPQQITVSVAISNRFSLEAIEELYGGIYEACDQYKVDLVGGDTSSSPTGLMISITAIGKAAKNDIVYRDGAKENDLLCVSGDLGAAYLGIQLLEREKQIFNENPKIQPDLSGNDYLLERFLKPEARWDIIKLLGELKVKPTAMIDISDGLASEVIHICTQSKVGCQLYEDKLPIDALTISTSLELNMEATICALNGGEDYELLFTIDQKNHDKIKDRKEISVIGHITDENTGMNMVGKGGGIIPIIAQGWDAFLNKKTSDLTEQ